jgi:hypothetical protein
MNPERLIPGCLTAIVTFFVTGGLVHAAINDAQGSLKHAFFAAVAVFLLIVFWDRLRDAWHGVRRIDPYRPGTHHERTHEHVCARTDRPVTLAEVLNAVDHFARTHHFRWQRSDQRTSRSGTEVTLRFDHRFSRQERLRPNTALAQVQRNLESYNQPGRSDVGVFNIPHHLQCHLTLTQEAPGRVRVVMRMVEDIDPERTVRVYSLGEGNLAPSWLWTGGYFGDELGPTLRSFGLLAAGGPPPSGRALAEVGPGGRAGMGDGAAEAARETVPQHRDPPRLPEPQRVPGSPRTTRDLCHDTVNFFIRHGLLASFERSGRYHAPAVARPLIPPAQAVLAHYAACEGPLYADAAQWQFAHDLVAGFTRRGRRTVASAVTLRQLFGPLRGVAVDDLLAQLAYVFEGCGFRTRGSSTVARAARFASEDRCAVSDLPEPYGKWLQHRLGQPRWEEEVDLEVEAECRLSSPEPGVVHMDLDLSAPALPLLDDLALGLGRLLGGTGLVYPSLPAILREAAGAGCRLLPPAARGW